VERLLGVETEYALGACLARGGTPRSRAGPGLEALVRNARSRLATLPDETSRGVFLQNGARFYVDCGGHPEFTTPECSNPWDVVRYIRAGELILLRLAGTLGGRWLARRPPFFRCNVDYSGTGSTWGCHESYMHRADPGLLPKQMIPHLVSRLVYAGAGGFDSLSPGVQFTLSPRAAHITRDVSHDSTSQRGIFHTKDEALCGNGYHRLHILCGESLCSELATWLKVGTTALVVALSEAGLCPGEAVQLRAPVAAMRLFAGDPTCTAAAETKAGERLTAIAIQRHYLAQAEAHAHASFMPSWAGEVCRRWRAVLDQLSDGWESVATSLDWAIKLALYREQARRHGFEWESLGRWIAVAAKLTAALARAGQGDRPLTARLVLDRRGPIAGEVTRLTSTVLREQGLDWDGFTAFLDVRNRLFEIDTRFGQLGSEGIFSSLGASGVLTHHVDGVDDVEYAVDNPPAVPRAQLRGQLVRVLTGHDGRYGCDWQGVWDSQDRKRIDLSDPFVAVAEWKGFPEESAVPPGSIASLEARLLMGRRFRRPTANETQDPISLNQTALDLRQRNRLDEAERLLRQAIEIEDAQVAADSPKRPHRRNNLAIVLMRAGRLEEAGRWNTAAWHLKAGQHDLTSGRILFVRIALRLQLDDRDVGLYVGQLKTLLGLDPLPCLGDIATTWEIPDVLDMLVERLRTAEADLLETIAATLDHRVNRPLLDAFEVWSAAPAVPLEAPWPGECDAPIA
jgi:Pup-ligase protein/Tetratricopeptide repeat